MDKTPRKMSKPNIGKGDYGFTDFIGTAIAHKSSWQAEACGTIDELNSFIGECVARNSNAQIVSDLTDISKNLFTLGADVASSMMTEKKLPGITTAHVHHLEELIIKYEENLPVIHSFILPLGPISVTALHQARTVCRRTERLMVRYLVEQKTEQKEDATNPLTLAYLNRLSDVLFAMARFVLKENNQPEIYWTRNDA